MIANLLNREEYYAISLHLTTWAACFTCGMETRVVFYCTCNCLRRRSTTTNIQDSAQTTSTSKTNNTQRKHSIHVLRHAAIYAVVELTGGPSSIRKSPIFSRSSYRGPPVGCKKAHMTTTHKQAHAYAHTPARRRVNNECGWWVPFQRAVCTCDGHNLAAASTRKTSYSVPPANAHALSLTGVPPHPPRAARTIHCTDT